MAIGARYLRGWLETTAFASGLGFGTVAYGVWTASPAASGRVLPMLAVLAAYPMLMVVCSVLALRRLRTGGKVWAYASAVLQLPLFPIGTVPGFVALVALSRTDSAAIAAEPKPAKVEGDGTGWFSNVVSGLVGIAAIGAIVVTNQWANQHGLHSPGFLVWLAVFVTAAYINIVIHECGHFVFGWMVRFRLYRFEVAPFLLRKTEGRWRFEIRRPYFSGGGVCGMAPDGLEDLSWRTAIFTLGGPLASFGFGAAATAMFLVSPRAGLHDAWVFFQLAGVVGLTLFVLNLIPVATAQHYTPTARPCINCGGEAVGRITCWRAAW